MKVEKHETGKYSSFITFIDLKEKLVDSFTKGGFPEVVKAIKNSDLQKLFEESTLVDRVRASSTKMYFSGMELGSIEHQLNNGEVGAFERFNLIDGNRICAIMTDVLFVPCVDTKFNGIQFEFVSSGPLAGDFNRLYDLLPLHLSPRMIFNNDEGITDIIVVDIDYSRSTDVNNKFTVRC